MITQYILPVLFFTMLLSCEKLVEIDPPIDSITTSEVFISENQAKQAMAGLYTLMMNGKTGNGHVTSSRLTLMASLSSDDLDCFNAQTNSYFPFNANRLTRESISSDAIWTGLYEIIFTANSVIEGIRASTAAAFPEKSKTKMIAECRFVRAFCFFYLTNFFGNVPMVTTTDFNETRRLPAASKTELYKQMTDDLLFARDNLPPVNQNSSGERIYPDKWAATALLARVYLFLEEYPNAWEQANAVILNTTQFTLEPAPENVFLVNSREAIWQLKQNTSSHNGTATYEGEQFIPGSGLAGIPFSDIYYNLPDNLLNAFEPDDKRKTDWTAPAAPNPQNVPGQFYFPHKYKTGGYNKVIGGMPTEFYMVLRLAEQFLIRAEAAAHGAGSLTDAIGDLNSIRHRAGLSDLPDDLDQAQVLAAVAQERRMELFCEWGHRWFDLKRTSKASAVLSLIPVKQPWQGDHQLLYPIPAREIEFNPSLQQNPGY